MVNACPISSATIQLIILRRGQYGFHVLLQPIRRTKIHTAYTFPLKLIYFSDTAVNGGTNAGMKLAYFHYRKSFGEITRATEASTKTSK